MNLGIVGVGAMGSLFAAYLAPITPLFLFGRWPQQLAVLNKNDLICSKLDGSIKRQKVRATADPTWFAAADLVLILVKSTQTTSAAHQLQAHLSPQTPIITLQNGLGNLDKITAVLPYNPVTSGVTAQGATMLEAGHVRHAGQGATYLDSTPQTAPAVEQLAAGLNTAGLETFVTTNLDALVWGKLVVNAGINPLTAILRQPNGVLVSNLAMQNLMVAAAQETAAVAAALGIELPYPDVAERVTAVAQATAHNQSSMLQDILRGAPTEIESICGAVVRYGRSQHVPTPINAALRDMVLALENGERTSAQVQLELEQLVNPV